MNKGEVERHIRKQRVFHIMYGAYPQATPDEMEKWRGLAAQYISGEIENVPMTIEAFRKQA